MKDPKIIEYMECAACGYKYTLSELYDSEYDYYFEEVTEGKNPFYKLVGQIFRFIVEKREDYGQANIIEDKKIFACPMCGTLKLTQAQ